MLVDALSSEYSQQDVHLWLICVNPSVAPGDIHWSCLDDEERQRARRFHADLDRWQYVKAHCWLRHMLGVFIGKQPREVALIHRAKSKPLLAPFGKPMSLHFSLSHTSGYIGIVISRCYEVGVDVENIQPFPNPQNFKLVLHPAERDWLYGLRDTERGREFFRIWTAKEAYSKALGIGLGLPFSDLSINIPKNSGFGRITSTRQFLNLSSVCIYSAFLNTTLSTDYSHAFSVAALSRSVSVRMHYMTEQSGSLQELKFVDIRSLVDKQTHQESDNKIGKQQ